MESIAVDNVVYTGDSGIFQIHTCTKVLVTTEYFQYIRGCV